MPAGLRRASALVAIVALAVGGAKVVDDHTLPGSGFSAVATVAADPTGPGGPTGGMTDGGGSQFQPPQMPSSMPDYQGGNNQPPMDQNSGISIYNTGSPGAQQVPGQQAGQQPQQPQQAQQPAHGTQIPDYQTATPYTQGPGKANPDYQAPQQNSPQQPQQGQQPQQQQPSQAPTQTQQPQNKQDQDTQQLDQKQQKCQAAMLQMGNTPAAALVSVGGTVAGGGGRSPAWFDPWLDPTPTPSPCDGACPPNTTEKPSLEQRIEDLEKANRAKDEKIAEQDKKIEQLEQQQHEQNQCTTGEKMNIGMGIVGGLLVAAGGLISLTGAGAAIGVPAVATGLTILGGGVVTTGAVINGIDCANR